MRNKLKKALLLFAILVNITSCIVTTQYDRQYPRKPRAHAMMRRPHPVKSYARYPGIWNPFGLSSSRSREHWQHHHGSFHNRAHVWPHKYVPHGHYKVKYSR